MSARNHLLFLRWNIEIRTYGVKLETAQEITQVELQLISIFFIYNPSTRFSGGLQQKQKKFFPIHMG